MAINRRNLSPMLSTVAAAAAIAAAPTAQADPPLCTYLSASSTECQTPGNVQINDSPPPVQYAPQYPYFGGNLIILHHQGHLGLGGHR
jgi:hypothetical protein